MTDLQIGSSVTIFSRVLVLLEYADAFTEKLLKKNQNKFAANEF